LAVRYVPPYNMQMSPKGFEKTRWWGRRRKAASDSFSELLRVAWPEAFCMIPLYITSGAVLHFMGELRKGED